MKTFSTDLKWLVYHIWKAASRIIQIPFQKKFYIYFLLFLK